LATYDLHQHLWPERFVAALRARTTPPLLSRDELVTREGRFVVDLTAHEADARLRILDQDEIDVAVLSLQTSLGLEALSPGEREGLEELWAEGMREIVSAGGGRFQALSPTRARAGFAGISLGASSLFDLDHAGPVLDEAAERGCLVFVHPSAGETHVQTQPGWWEWVVGYTSQMQAAYFSWLAGGRERWPMLRVVFAILAGGGPVQLERLAHQGVDVRSALDPNTFFDVATYGRRAIELVIETFGVEQLVYGSDTPVVDPRHTLEAVRGFGDSVAQLLQMDTPEALLR
jgi:predicted TIM-barrel fold metal-dependent hydrolase